MLGPCDAVFQIFKVTGEFDGRLNWFLSRNPIALVRMGTRTVEARQLIKHIGIDVLKIRHITFQIGPRAARDRWAIHTSTKLQVTNFHFNGPPETDSESDREEHDGSASKDSGIDSDSHAPADRFDSESAETDSSDSDRFVARAIRFV